MDKCLTLKLFILIIEIVKIYTDNIFKQFDQNNEIIFIHPLTSNNIIYLTLTSSYKIENNINTIIKENIFNFTQYSRVIMYNEADLTILSSCTKNNFVEYTTIDGVLKVKRQYDNNYISSNTTYICPIYYYSSTSRIYIGYSNYIVASNKMNVRAYQISFTGSTLGSSSIGNLETSIGNYVKITDKKIIENILVGNSNYRIHKKVNSGLNLNSNTLIEATESDFKVSLIDNNDAIVYYFESKLKLFYISSTNKYKYEIDTISSFDFDYIELSEMINNNNEKKFICVYKSNVDNNLYIELFSLNGNKFEMKYYYQIKNNIGISKIFIKKFSDSNNYFILLRGSDSNIGKYEYFSKSDLDSFSNTKIYNCNSQTETFLTSSKKNIIIKIEDISINNLSSNDEMMLYPNNLNYQILNETHIEITISKDNGYIEFNSGFKSNYNNYIIKFTRIEECKFKIQICNEACSLCNEIISENQSPTKCSSKRCNDGYYYLENDDTECIKLTQTCYETCNFCNENGDNINHKCINCKYGYEKYGNNCIICDMNKKYWYYDPNLNFKECLYESNNCPIDYPLLVENSNQCIDTCPFGYYLKDNECFEEYYFIDSTDQKIYFSHEGCDDVHSYVYYNSNNKECIIECSARNYYLISNSKFCIDKCENVNLIENNGECICSNGNVNIDSNNQISCIGNNINLNSNNEQLDNVLDSIISSHSLDSALELIEDEINILKLYDNVILDVDNEIKIQVLNSSIVNGLDSNIKYGSIDLGECETILKKHYNLDFSLPLITLLINSESKTSSLTNNLNYYVYSQDGKKLDLSLCSNVKIAVYNSIPSDNSINFDLINELSEQGINLFDINDNFYQDKCFPYKLNGNDVTIKDRREDIFSNVSICEVGCTFIEFNQEYNRVKCDCSVKTTIEEQIPIKQHNNFFKNINEQINYELFKCYPVFKNFKTNFYKNLGFWIWLFTFLCILIGFLIYLFYTKAKLYSDVYSNYNKNYNIQSSNPPKKSNLNQKLSLNGFKSIETTTSLKNEKQNDNKLEISEEDSDLKIPKITTYNSNKYEKSRNVNFNNSIKPIQLKSSSRISFDQSSISDLKSSKHINKNDTIQTEKSLFTEISNTFVYKKRHKDAFIVNADTNKNNKDFRERIKSKYTGSFNKKNEEQTTFWDFTYDKAINSENKFYFHHICSFLFIKLELISIIFFPEYYHYYSITIPIYILSLFIDFSFNAILFTDHIVSQKYYNKGKLSFMTELILSFISNIVTSLIMKFLKKLIEFSYAFETLKHETKEEKHYHNLSSILLRIVHKKLIINFILDIIICILCGYYLYIFCEVYNKSQVSLIINFLIGMGISICIVIGITIIVCVLRLIGIKMKNKNLYYSSRYIGQLV